MKKEKKICHLTSVHNRYDIRIFKKECISLSKEGYDVSLIVADGLGDEEKEGVKIYDVGKSNKRLERVFITTKRILKKAIKLNSDIFHFHDPELIPIGLKLKKYHNKIVFYDVHEDLPRQILSKYYLPFVFRKPLSVLVEFYENFAAKKIDQVIAATPFIRDRFLKINAKSIDINNFPILDEFSIEITDFESKKNQICYIGGITKKRGIEELVKAVNLTDCKLVIAGKYSPEDLGSQLKNNSYWDKEKVVDKGFVDRNEIKNILTASKIGIVTLHPIINYLDSLPIKMFEYMAAGIPFIASNFPYWQEIVDEYNCGICVNPLCPSEIAKGIDFLLKNEELARVMGEKGSKAVQNHFNWDKENKKLINIYHDFNK